MNTSAQSAKLLVTTAIAYANGAPHAGHLYESILADALRRIHILAGKTVKLLTGTDEYGKKIQQTAAAALCTPIDLCNKNAAIFAEVYSALMVKYDYFIRTTQEIHTKTVRSIIADIMKTHPGAIYLTEYTGYYSIREERFISPFEAESTKFCDPVTGTKYEIMSEPTYNFKLSKFRCAVDDIFGQHDPHEQHNQYDHSNHSNNCLISPKSFATEILERSANLEDLSITRTSFDWGIPFGNTIRLNDDNVIDDKSTNNTSAEPAQSNHVVYVWFDALINYITGAKILFGDISDNTYMNVGADSYLHVIGRDILWFHAVIYPCILNAAGLWKDIKNNFKIIVHGHVLDESGRKMSKSVGNVITSETLLQKCPIAAIRFYLLSKAVGGDIPLSIVGVNTLYNDVFVKDFGNLFQRIVGITRPIQAQVNAILAQLGQENSSGAIKSLNAVINDAAEDPSILIRHAMGIVHKCNKTIAEMMPWKMGVDHRAEFIVQIAPDFAAILCLFWVVTDQVIDLLQYLGWHGLLTSGRPDIGLIMPANLQFKIVDGQTNIIAFHRAFI